MKNDLIELCALWKKEGKNGEFYTGSINGLDVLVFPNKHKKEAKQPDFRVYLAKKEKKEDRPNETAPMPSFPKGEIPF